LGICLGFQAMVVEYCRNVMQWADATSAEFNKDGKPVIMFMPEIDKDQMGGTMRLGSRSTKFTHSIEANGAHNIPSISQCLYHLSPEHHRKEEESSEAGNMTSVIWERHRHRYEVNPDFVDEIHNSGLKLVGRDAETGMRMEVAELPLGEHPYYVGCQYHPEFQSRPLHPSPPFLGLIMASRDDGASLQEYLFKA
jgi:CTP synthase